MEERQRQTYEVYLKQIHSESVLWNKLKLFVYDLKIFGNNETSEAFKRLDNNTSDFYLSNDYFSDLEKERILTFPTGTGLSLKELFKNEIYDKKEICTSHTLAPIFQRVFGIRKDFEKEKTFDNFQKKFNKQYNQSRKRK